MSSFFITIAPSASSTAPSSAVSSASSTKSSTCLGINQKRPFQRCVESCLDNSDAESGLCYYNFTPFCKSSGAFDCGSTTPVRCYFNKWGDCLLQACPDEWDRYDFVQRFQSACQSAGSPISSIAGDFGRWLTETPGMSSSTPTSSSSNVQTSSGDSSTTQPPIIVTVSAPTTVTPEPTTATEKESGLSTGAIAGTAVGIVAFLVLLISAIFLFLRRRKRKSSPSQPDEPITSEGIMIEKAELDGADHKPELLAESYKPGLQGETQHQAELHGETAVWELDAGGRGAELHREPAFAELDAGPRTPPSGSVRGPQTGA